MGEKGGGGRAAGIKVGLEKYEDLFKLVLGDWTQTTPLFLPS